MQAKIHSITRLRINSDGEGVRSVVFFYGCPLNCCWCCNPETHSGNNYELVSIQQLYELIARDIIYFQYSNGGVTFSGGEPLLFADYIFSFLEKYGNLFNTNIETSLYADYQSIYELIPFINEWLIDFKVFDNGLHYLYTGQGNEIIKSNISNLITDTDKSKIMITYPIITQKNDSLENVSKIIEYMMKKGLHRIELHPYRKKSESKYLKLGISYDDIPELSREKITEIYNLFSKAGIKVIIRNTQTGKNKCTVLKNIRKNYCRDNGIALHIPECDFKGICQGTCPQCERELDYINSITT